MDNKDSTLMVVILAFFILGFTSRQHLFTIDFSGLADQPIQSPNNLTEDCMGTIVDPPEEEEMWAIPDKSVYGLGETVNFLVKSNQTGKARYSIREDKNTLPLIEGEIDLFANSVTTITANLDYPGFLLFQLEQNGNKVSAGAGIEPCAIEPTMQKPDDFDQFWTAQLEELKNTPMNPTFYKVKEQSGDFQTTYKVILDNVGNKKVYGWISIPNCEGPFSTVLTVPSYGRAPIGPLTYVANDGLIAATFSIHNYDIEKEVPKEIAYQPEDHYFNRHTNYYRSSILGGIQMINFLFTLPEFDQKHLGITGISQGGGIAVMIAGLDERIKYLAQAQATFCDHSGILKNRPSGFPYWIVNADLKGGDPEEVVKEVAYYDAVNFATNFKGVSFHTLGYKDDVCPPATVFAAYNKMKGEKYMLHGVNNGHDLPKDFWPKRRIFWEEHMPIKKAPNCNLSSPTPPVDTVATSSPFFRLNGEVNVSPIPGDRKIQITVLLKRPQKIRVDMSSLNGQVLGREEVDHLTVGENSFSISSPVTPAQIAIVSIYLDGELSYSQKVFLAN